MLISPLRRTGDASGVAPQVHRLGTQADHAQRHTRNHCNKLIETAPAGHYQNRHNAYEPTIRRAAETEQSVQVVIGPSGEGHKVGKDSEVVGGNRARWRGGLLLGLAPAKAGGSQAGAWEPGDGGLGTREGESVKCLDICSSAGYPRNTHLGFGAAGVVRQGDGPLAGSPILPKSRLIRPVPRPICRSAAW